MNPEIQKLLEVQEIDAELLELQTQLNNFPAIWEEMKHRLRKKTEAFEQAAARDSNNESERKRIEAELRANTEKLKKYQAQQMLVKTSKELSAISTQIDGVKKTIQRLEESGTLLLDSSNEVQEKAEQAKAELDAQKDKARDERDRLRKQVSTKKARIAQLQAAREQLVGKVDADHLKRYETVRRRHPGDAIVSVRNGSCLGCHFAVLPNRLVVVRLGEEPVTCDNCGRILSQDEDYVPPKDGEA